MADRDTATHSPKHPQMQLRQGNDRGVRFKGCWWGVGWGVGGVEWFIRGKSYLPGDGQQRPKQRALLVETAGDKLQVLVYDTRPSTTVITEYDIGLPKLSANGQCFIGVQIAISL